MPYWPHSDPHPGPLSAKPATAAETPASLGPCPGRHRPRPEGVPPVAGRPIWCLHHTTEICEALAQLPGHYVRLELDKARATRGPTDRVSGSANPASPSPQGDEQDELVRWYVAWEEIVRGLLGHGPRPRVTARPARSPDPATAPSLAALTLAQAHSYLTVWLEAALAHPDIAQALGEEILAWAGRLAARVKDRPPRRHRPVPCPRCQLRSLIEDVDRGYVECINQDCGRLMTLPEYGEYVRTLTAEQVTGSAAPAAGQTPAPPP